MTNSSPSHSLTFRSPESALREKACARIVLVEDEPLIALDIKRRLTSFGHQVVGVSRDGNNAIALVTRLAPDLVVLDIRLQGPMDGIEVAEKLAQESAVGVIFLSGNGDEATIERAQATAPFHFMIKPVRSRELMISIDAALHHHRRNLQLRSDRKIAEGWLRDRAGEIDAMRRLLQIKSASQARLERELHRARERADVVLRTRTLHLEALGKEIVTPARAFAAGTDWLATTPLDGEQHQLLANIKQAANAALAAMETLTSYAELTAGKAQLSASPVDFRNLLAQTLDPLGVEARTAGVELTCDITPELPRTVSVDSRRLAQALSLLARFYLKNITGGEVDIQCDGVSPTDAKAYVHISIVETAGLLSPTTRRVAERLSHSTDEALRDPEESALGLTVAKLLVQRLGGVLWFESIPASVNSFHIALWLETPPPDGT